MWSLKRGTTVSCLTHDQLLEQAQMIVLVLYISFQLTLCNSVQLLVLVPWPSDRDDAGWDVGLDLLAGGRVAVNEINNTTDLLKDYHIELLVPEYGHEACGLRETSQGLVNFVQHSIYPPGQVLAVLGLYCSTSTKEISLLAGHESVQLIQLSAANSPIFDPEINEGIAHQSDYPHLWRFLTSATVYANMMMELMNMYSWNGNIVVIHRSDVNFYNVIAQTLIDKVSDRILFDIDLRILFLNESLDRIYNEGGRIIFVATTSLDAATLLCEAAGRGMLYPDYMWIVADYALSFLEDAHQCDTSLLHLAVNGSIFSSFSLEPQDKTLSHVNGDTYSAYESKYYEELSIVAEEYNQTLLGDHQYAGLLYDQVWAFALAFNSSLPELSEHNLSVTDIGSLGYSEAKDVFEDKLSQLDFIGASGRIRFNNKREVSTSIDIYQVINGQQKSVGNCTVGNDSVMYCNITLAETPPSSELGVVTKFLQLPMTLTIVMHIITALTVVLVTTVMVVFLYNRKRPEIMGTSWKLSMLQFFACYLLCIRMILVTLDIEYNHIGYCFIFTSVEINAINLLIVTSFVRVYRVYQIFHNKRLRKLGWQYSNGFLVFLAIVLSLIPIVILVLWYSNVDESDIISLSEPEIEFDGTMRYYLVVERYCFLASSPVNISFSLIEIVYLDVFIIANIIFASQTSKSYKNLKDTKKVILLMSTMFVLHTIYIFLLFNFLLVLMHVNAYWDNFVANLFALCNILACIFIFYIPKLWWIKDIIIK